MSERKREKWFVATAPNVYRACKNQTYTNYCCLCDAVILLSISQYKCQKKHTEPQQECVMFNAHPTTCIWHFFALFSVVVEKIQNHSNRAIKFLLSDAAFLCRQANRQMNSNNICNKRIQILYQNAATKTEKHSSHLFDRYYCYEQCMLINFNSCCDSLFPARAHTFFQNISTLSTQQHIRIEMFARSDV